MSVEGGSVGGGIGGGVAVAGPSFEAAPVVVNEGPVRGSLEGFRPMNTSDINTIDFKGGTIAPSQPLVIQQAEEVAGAAWEKSELPASPRGEPTPAQAVSQAQAIISEAQQPALEQQEAIVVPNIIPAWMPDHLTQPQSLVVPIISPITSTIVEDNVFLAVNPLLEPVAKTGLSPKLEARTSHQVARAVSPQPLLPASPELQRGEQEQVVEEEVLEKVEHEEPKDSLEEEEETEKRLFLEDEKASAVRKFEIKQAVKLAFASVKDAKLSTVVGSLVARFLPGEHTGNRSQALHEKGPDGSYEETVEAIASSGEFSSEKQAEKRFEDIVSEKKPIKNSKEGSPVADGDVARVFKFRAVKPPTAVEIYIKRVVKKQAQVLAGPVAVETKIETSSETNLKELSPELAEVFEKAA